MTFVLLMSLPIIGDCVMVTDPPVGPAIVMILDACETGEEMVFDEERDSVRLLRDGVDVELAGERGIVAFKADA